MILPLLLLLQTFPGSIITAGGGSSAPSALVSRTVTGNATVNGSDDLIFVNVTAADVPVISLPAASTRNRPLQIWNIGTSAVKVTPNGSDNLNGGNVSEYISMWATARTYFSDGTQFWSVPSSWQSIDVRKGGYLYEDFQVLSSTATNTVTGSTNLEAIIANSGVVTGGIVGSYDTLSTGAVSATGRASVHSGVGVGFMGTGGFYVLQMGILTDANLSTAGETYAIYAGFGDNDGSGDMTDGVYFGYTHSVNSGKWTGNTGLGGVHSSITGGTTTTFAASTYYDLRICVDNRTGTPVAYFWVNDVYQGQLTTNIPTASANAFAHCFFKIEKAVGTAARTLSVDYVMYNSTVVTTPR